MLAKKHTIIIEIICYNLQILGNYNGFINFATNYLIMKRINFVITLLAISVFSMAQPPEGKANKGDSYGENFKYTTIINAANLPEKLENKESLEGVFKAKVLEVCPKKGCWLKLEINDNTTAFVKMKDYAFFLPVAVEGKYILLNGVASIKTTSVEELKHYAEDAKKTQQEIDAITKAKKEINLLASGIIVAD